MAKCDLRPYVEVNVAIEPGEAMSDAEFNTTILNGWMQRYRAGDLAARDELFQACSHRLERLARKMLRSFPQVRRWEDTLDVMQNAIIRLCRALEQVQFDSTRQFFGLAAEQMRRELIDLWRHYRGAEGVGANHASAIVAPPNALEQAVDRGEPTGDVEDWGRFHEEVERLPAEEREVVGLTFYHGWSQSEVAELFQIDERTVRRRWQRAMLKLRGALQRAE